MSRLEDLLFEAEKLGIRREVLNRVGEIRKIKPKMSINDVYDRAYTEVMAENKLKHEKIYLDRIILLYRDRSCYLSDME